MKKSVLQRTSLALAFVTITIALAACRSAQEPNYQGHRGTAPTVYDYYPPRTNNVNQPK